LASLHFAQDGRSVRPDCAERAVSAVRAPTRWA